MQPNQQQRPLVAPANFATLEERLAALRAEYAQKEQVVEQKNGNAPADADLFAPETPRQQAEQTQRDQVEEWLAPLTADMTSTKVMPDVNPESKEFQHFLDHFFDDPAVKDIQPEAEEFLMNVRTLRSQGGITDEQMKQGILNFLDRVAMPLLREHHSNKKKKRSLIHPNILNKSQTMTKLGMQNSMTPDGRVSKVDLGGPNG